MSPGELLQRINRLHGTTFTLLEKYADGEQGAFVVIDALNKKWVLKWADGAHNLPWMQGAKTVTDVLGSIGYPAPSYLLIGKMPEGIYSIQSMLPGVPIRELTATLLPHLYELNRLQVGRAIAGRNDWHQEVVKTVLVGGDGYCLHASLEHHSQDSADLLRALQRLVMRYQDEPHRTNDIVHGDFQHSNILIQDERVSGVVDWDGWYAGDCSFDIATLLFYAYDTFEIHELLWNYALEQVSLKLLSMYLAHLILRQVDWSLRYHDEKTSERYIKRGQMVMWEIEQRFRVEG